jgi:endonuclease/exonuclease/phosphatase (EEP) superfamily protein YafD
MVSAITRILSCVALLSASGASNVSAGLSAKAAQAPPVAADRVGLLHYNSQRSAKLKVGDRLKFAIWNVHKFTDSLALDTVEYFSETADFILLQESMVGGRYNSFFQNMADHQWLSAQSFSKGKFVFTGVTTGTRYQVSNSYGIRSDAREPILKTPKMLVVTELPIEGMSVKLMVVNIHGINFVSNADYASQLDQLIPILKEHQGPVVLAGDFNMWSIDRALMLNEVARLADLEYVPLDDDHRTLPLDQMFVRGLLPHEARVMNDINGSDHRPLWVDLELL